MKKISGILAARLCGPLRNSAEGGAVRVLLACAVSAALAFLLVSAIVRADSGLDFRIAGDLMPSSSPASSMHSLLEMSSKDSGDSFDRSTDSLEALSEKLDALAPSSTALSSSTWTSARAGYLDYLDSDLKYLVSTALGTPASGSVGGKVNDILADTADIQPKLGDISDYSGTYSSGTSLFLALKNIRDTLEGTLSLSGDLAAGGGYGSTGVTLERDGDIWADGNVYAKGPVANVMAFGATGDGSTDDTAAIQSAIDSLDTAGGTLYFPIGTYKITSTLYLDANVANASYEIVGSGKGTILKPVNTSHFYVFSVNDTNADAADGKVWAFVGHPRAIFRNFYVNGLESAEASFCWYNEASVSFQHLNLYWLKYGLYGSGYTDHIALDYVDWRYGRTGGYLYKQG